MAASASPMGGSSTPPSRQTTSNGFKFVVGGALLLMTGASLYVAVTNNFSSGVPEVLWNAPHDIPTNTETEDRHLEKGSMPWKIKEKRPWKINLSEKKQEFAETKPIIETKPLESKVTEKKTEVKEESRVKKEVSKKLRGEGKKVVKETPKNKTAEAPKGEGTKVVRETPKNKTAEAPKQETKQSDGEQAQKDSTKKKKSLNILLLYGDDWRHDSLGSASNGLVRTPFLDNLATQGMRFTHNCVTTSVCWVSRATLYTGQYVSRHNSTEPMNPGFYKGWNKTFPYLLREAGYYFGHVGKWHFKDYAEFVKPQLDWERFYYGRHWFNERGGLIHTTKKNERDAIDFLRERPKDKPFCLTVCFFTPHAQDGDPEQYLPQNESLALYVNDTIPVAPSATEEAWKKMPNFFRDINAGRSRYFWRFDTPEKHQKMMKNYYRLISEIDSSSEKIVKELEDQGVLDDTLIIFTTDNGYFHAEHGLADKFYPYQESIRVPMIVRDPRMQKNKVGRLNDEFTLSIDLAPTILGAAGLPTPDVMHGRDFAPLYTGVGDTTPWRKEFFYEHPIHLKKEVIPASEALVRKDHKYMLWPDYDVEQLFDLRNDTYELNDLIESESHKGLLGEMRTRFNELKKIAK